MGRFAHRRAQGSWFAPRALSAPALSRRWHRKPRRPVAPPGILGGVIGGTDGSGVVTTTDTCNGEDSPLPRGLTTATLHTVGDKGGEAIMMQGER